MVFLFTVCINEYVASKLMYLFWYSGISFFSYGSMIIMPTIYVKCFGQKNLIIVHGLVQLISVGIYRKENLRLFFDF